MVTCAANGREAFDTFVDRPAGSFDAILMDIMMPVMDGYEAARAIRRSVKADVGSVSIFAMTANAFAEDAQRAHDAGMNGHLTKPIDMEKVKQALATNALPVLRSPADVRVVRFGFLRSLS